LYYTNKEMEKTFKVTQKVSNSYFADKNYYYEVKVNNSTIHLVHVYNSISNTYMGTTIDGTFVENVRGFLREYPKFFEEFEGIDPDMELMEMGFTHIS